MNNKEEYLGTLERMRVGAHMSWVLLLDDNETYLTAGCLDEVRACMKDLNFRCKKGMVDDGLRFILNKYCKPVA